jgi:hypothetical protein
MSAVALRYAAMNDFEKGLESGSAGCSRRALAKKLRCRARRTGNKYQINVRACPRLRDRGHSQGTYLFLDMP